MEVAKLFGTKSSVQISRGIEALFGTRDENVRLLETGLNVPHSVAGRQPRDRSEPADVARAEAILADYVTLVSRATPSPTGDLNCYFRVVTEDGKVALHDLVTSGRQRNFGKKPVAPSPATSAATWRHRAQRPGLRRRAGRHWQTYWPWPWPSPRCSARK